MENERTKYFDEYMDSIFASGVKLTPEEFEQGAGDIEAMYGRFMPAARDAAILDVGSGAGHFLYFLKKKGYSNFTGIDMSPQQVEFCKKNVSDKVVLADAFEYLRDKNEAFALISLNDVIEHIPKEKVVPLLSLLRSSLKPGGQLVLKTPNLGNFFSVYGRYKDFTHETGFTERSLKQVLWLAGFREITIFGPEAPPPGNFKGKVQRQVERGIRFVLGKLYWYQGYVAPEIMTPLLAAAAVKR
jgi:2-polyprenyl-3-methyl-5-hydroxy-6-metoxy-1,4-benzoquinol methylase